MKKIKFVCRYCGSDNVSVDAYVDWNPEKQEWSDIRAVYESATCHECGDSCKLKEVPYADSAQMGIPNQESNNAS